ncbi:MarR family winged helix-turn-helix transcriptional regulator [Actinoplanes friuliensis]|jgi:DNA-binding MarR family transcriptional regulator|uniref:Putative MarR-family transcriptional regulator n=1 Tax=Actinoplanes friuliensis DSM 7358 TaxID=1246995 RepID=U5W4I2_9ACTN|nr:MarR family transcriptional regulator [Actinoplanes friuliensis]AGZ42900.1 putative MarR-family transcriptional regulator [Actinoplanes friuliensis DSM 7358]
MSESAAPPGDPGIQDLGWALTTVLRNYLHAVGAAVSDVPGGPRGYQVLNAAAGGHCRNQAAIAELLAVDRTVMTYLIDDLERSGLVERRPDPADRRSRQVLLTAKGKQTHTRLRERITDAERHVLGGLSGAEVEALRGLLGRAALHADNGNHPIDACTAAAELTATA